MYSKDVIILSDKINKFLQDINDYLPDEYGNYLDDVWNTDGVLKKVYDKCYNLSIEIANSSFCETDIYKHILKSLSLYNAKDMLDSFVYYVSLLYSLMCMNCNSMYRKNLNETHECEVVLLRKDLDKVIENLHTLY